MYLLVFIISLVYWDTAPLQNQVSEVFAQLNEIEVQLSTMEAWTGLPPECFLLPNSFYNTNNVNTSNAALPITSLLDPDQVSHEAQTLVEAVKLIQKGLLEMISKSKKQDLISSDISKSDMETS